MPFLITQFSWLNQFGNDLNANGDLSDTSFDKQHFYLLSLAHVKSCNKFKHKNKFSLNVSPFNEKIAQNKERK